MTSNASRRYVLVPHAGKPATDHVRMPIRGYLERRCGHEQREETRTRKGKRRVMEEEATHVRSGYILGNQCFSIVAET